MLNSYSSINAEEVFIINFQKHFLGFTNIFQQSQYVQNQKSIKNESRKKLYIALLTSPTNIFEVDYFYTLLCLNTKCTVKNTYKDKSLLLTPLVHGFKGTNTTTQKNL